MLYPTKTVERTEKLFKEAFAGLIKEKGYSKVTVKDIVEKADFNRSSFYNYFNDKEAIAEDITLEIIAGFIRASRKPYENSSQINFNLLSPSSLPVFEYIYDSRKYFDLLTVVDTIPNLGDRLIQAIKNIYKEELQFISNKNTVDFNSSNLINYRTYGFYGMIHEWITSRYMASPQEMTKELISLFCYSTPSAKVKVVKR